MQYIITAIIIAVISIILKYIFGADVNKLKKFIQNEKLDKIIKKYPTNIEICKDMLKSLENENVKVQETEQEASMYIAIGNTINIGKIEKSYTRIQTIAHECLHSIQNRRLLVFNFIISNIFFIYFAIIIILRFFKVEYIVNNQTILLVILAMIGFAYFAIRTYLENEAMSKASFISKEYIESQNISSKEENKEIIEEYNKLYDLGIRCVNYNIFLIVSVIIFLFSMICFVR